MASEAVLVADVTIYIKVFTLVTFAVLPLPVVVTDADGGTDVPAVETVVLVAVAEPVAQFQTEVHKLVCMGVV